MKKLITVLFLLMVCVVGLLYCAHLDGIVHIQAFAAGQCEFCKFIEEYDLEADLNNYPIVITEQPSCEINYELALFEKVTFKAKGAERAARGAIFYNVPFRYCPECGRMIIWDKH